MVYTYHLSLLSWIALSFDKVLARFTVKARHWSRRIHVYLPMLYEDDIQGSGKKVVPLG
jgi:hypothetical protein